MTAPTTGTRHTVLGAALRVRTIGEGTPTVLLHGGGPGCSAWTDFAALVPELHGRRLILVDLPQYGESDAPRVTGRCSLSTHGTSWPCSTTWAFAAPTSSASRSAGRSPC